MDANADRLEFAPPHEPAAFRAFTLAIIAHVLLMAALTWGINWKKETENLSAEAELWTAVPKEAAPPPVPNVITPPAPSPPPPPVQERKVETPPPPPIVAQPNITIEREKRKQELAKQRAEELELQKKLEAKKKREEVERDKKLEAKREQDELKKQRVAQEKAAEEKQRKEDAVKAKANEKKSAAMREQNIERMRKLAGTNPNPSPDAVPGGGGARPSSGYAARIAARIRPYIRHPQDVPGNPPVEIEVKTSPDGTIVGQRVTKSSGNAAWDESAIRAVIAATTLPRNEEGRVVSPITVILRQRDQ